MSNLDKEIDKDMGSVRGRGKAFLAAAAIVFTVLVADILVAKAQVMAGASNPLHFGDTVQFILLLVAVVLFVIGAIHSEILAGGKNIRKR